MHCFKTQMGTGMFKRISFLLVEKAEKKLLAEHRFALKDFNLVGFFTVERCPVLKRNQSGKFLTNFQVQLAR